MMRLLAFFLATFVLTGCGSQQAGYEIDGSNKHALSLTRTQDYPGSDWKNYLVVSRFPECQRRYRLGDTGDSYKMDVYRAQPGVFILNQSKHWYVTETQTCRWQEYPEPPAEPGELVGTFQTKADELAWVDKEAKKENATGRAPAVK